MELSNLAIWEIYGIPILFLSGVIFHFIYKWSNKAHVVASIGAVNESMWEHMKIAFWPMFLWSVLALGIWGFDREIIYFSRGAGIILTQMSIPLLVKLYTHFSKRNILFVDITLFLICIAFGQLLSHYLLNFNILIQAFTPLVIVIVVLLALAFILFSHSPPRLNLFRDPISKRYGHEDKRNR